MKGYLKGVLCIAISGTICLSGCSLFGTPQDDDDYFLTGSYAEVSHEATSKNEYKWFLKPSVQASNIITSDLSQINTNNSINRSFIDTSITTLGNTMSPVAMLLTGVTVAKLSLKDTFNNYKVYLLSITRLIILPLLGILILKFININETLKICTICTISMPLGLNTIIVPAAYDLDTKEASSMSLISHLLSAITIPLIFLLFEYIIL